MKEGASDMSGLDAFDAGGISSPVFVRVMEMSHEPD